MSLLKWVGITFLLSGKVPHTLDNKNRMRLPFKFREELGETVVAMLSGRNTIFIYSPKEFEERIAPIAEAAQFDDEGQDTLSKVMAHTYVLESDAQGRYLLPQELIALAEIKKDIVTIGKFTKAEIYAAEKFERLNVSAGYTASDLAFLKTRI